ncbi:DUF1572 family protein [uncultured Tenacibaculum sp.]|uniref:DUF1572 family protein n=1 Tax=uncultured Tenacibaculum sp. TaxID=174713 RepID=UPI00261592C1|nr:DUF1572 family protein [uncultured Tenacibaculum sp.]
MVEEYLYNIKKQFLSYKEVADKTLKQLHEEDLHWTYNNESNSIAMLMIHLSENMLSRWTDFFTSDGEKENRNRDAEFEPQNLNKEQLTAHWEQGWNCLFDALDSLNESNFNTPIYIRNKEHKLIESISRQIAHYPYHIGQIAYIGKMILNDRWQTASIAKGKSKEFIQAQFEQNKKGTH